MSKLRTSQFRRHDFSQLDSERQAKQEEADALKHSGGSVLDMGQRKPRKEKAAVVVSSLETQDGDNSDDSLPQKRRRRAVGMQQRSTLAKDGDSDSDRHKVAVDRRKAYGQRRGPCAVAGSASEEERSAAKP